MMPDSTIMIDPQGKKWNIPAAQIQAATAKGLKPAPASPPTPVSAPPPTTTASQGLKLGPWGSSVVRPIAKGANDIVNFIPDAVTGAVNLIPESVLGPKAQKPGDIIDQYIDKYTTAPETRVGKAAELGSEFLVGGMAGPKMPRVSSASPIVKRLASEDVVTTPGMRAAAKGTSVGKTLGALEEKAGAILPPIRNARAKATEQWNTARLNEALRYAGEKPLPKGLTGRDAAREAYQALKEGYNKALTGVKIDFSKDPKFKQAMQDAREYFNAARSPTDPNAKQLGPDQTRWLKDIIDNDVVKNFSRTGQMTGDMVKRVEETLRTNAERLEDGNPDDRKLSQILYGLRDAFKAMVTRQNPEAGEKLERLDKGYSSYKLSARAGNYNVKGEGGYTPAQRLQASKARDTSKDRNDFFTGEARGQTEAEEAQRVLGNTQPDSGTPFGNVLAATALGLGGHAITPGYGALLAASPLAYSQPALKFLQNRALTEDPELLSKLGLLGVGGQADITGAVK